MKLKKCILPLVLSSLSASLMGCNSSSNDDRWYLSREDVDNFAQAYGQVEYLGDHNYQYSFDYGTTLFNRELNEDDFIVYDVKAAQTAFTDSDKEYTDYAIFNDAKLKVSSFSTDEDKTKFSVNFSSESNSEYGILINKDATLSNSFMLVNPEEEDVNLGEDGVSVFEESYSSASSTWVSGKTAVQIIGSIGQIVAGIFSSTINPVGIVTGVMGFITNIGDAFSNGDAKIRSLIDKVNEINNRIGDLSEKMEANHSQLLDQLVRTDAKVDSILLGQAEAAITAFNTNYVKPIDNYNAYLADNLAELYKNFIQSPQDIKLKVYQNDKNEWCYTSLVESDGSYNLKISVSSFKNAKEYLASCKNVVKNGFIAALQKDITNAVDESSLPTGFSKDKAGEFGTAMVGELLLQSYFSTNKEKASEYRELVNNYAKSFDGTYNSILNNYISRLEFMYNFSGEIKTLVRSLVAKFMLYLDFNTARALEACVYAELDTTDFESHFASARNAMMKAKQDIYALGDNYSFALSSHIGGNFMSSKYSTYYTNPGNKCTFHVDFVSKKYTVGEDGAIATSITNLADHNYLVENDYTPLITRYNNVKSFDEDIAKYDFTHYVANYSSDVKAALNAYSHYLECKIVDSNSYRFYTGSSTRELYSNDSISLICEHRGNESDYFFKLGETYNYRGSRDDEYWYGQIMESKYLSASTGYSIGSGRVASWARYAEDHWYWKNDEYWSFVDTTEGNYYFILEKQSA